MRSGAFVEILGRLGSDVKLKTTVKGKTYGVLSIAINKKNNTSNDNVKPQFSTKWFKAFIWNEQLLTKMEPLLKSGKKILLIGELDVVPATTPDTKPQNIIVVRSKSGIAVLADSPMAEIDEEASIEDQEDLITEEVMG